MRRILSTMCAIVVFTASIAQADTYGNTEPFEIQSGHSPNFVLGTEVEIPVDGFTLESFGMMYGHENSGDPSDANAIFGLYTSGQDGLPETLVAVTNEINLTSQQTYDNIAFTSTPVVDSGTYWMMALYQTSANPRMTVLDGDSKVSYWSNVYGNGMPGDAPTILNYNGQDFNYWVNGTAGSGCGYTIKKSKAKKGCQACPSKGDDFTTEEECEKIKDCTKKIKTTIACPTGNGICKIKAKRSACG